MKHKKKGRRCELFRVFILKNPSEILKEKQRFWLFNAILRENIDLGFRTCVVLADELPKKYSYSYSDFYCIPDEIASLSISPYYLISTFTKDSTSDRLILDYYTDFSLDLLEMALNKNFNGAFEWSGGSDQELREKMLSGLEKNPKQKRRFNL